MREQQIIGPSPPAVRLLLDGSNEFTGPVRVLSDLKAADVSVLPEGSPHSIAQILAHMHFWQRFMLGLMRQESPAYPKTEEDGWPEVAAEQWPELVADFLADLDTLKSLTFDEAILAREYKPNVTVGYLICDAALHNAYHLGQIVLLRCMLELWPPVGGAGYGYWQS